MTIILNFSFVVKVPIDTQPRVGCPAFLRFLLCSLSTSPQFNPTPQTPQYGRAS